MQIKKLKSQYCPLSFIILIPQWSWLECHYVGYNIYGKIHVEQWIFTWNSRHVVRDVGLYPFKKLISAISTKQVLPFVTKFQFCNSTGNVWWKLMVVVKMFGEVVVLQPACAPWNLQEKKKWNAAKAIDILELKIISLATSPWGLVNVDLLLISFLNSKVIK